MINSVLDFFTLTLLISILAAAYILNKGLKTTANKEENKYGLIALGSLMTNALNLLVLLLYKYFI